jgi:hypothetical protein
MLHTSGHSRWIHRCFIAPSYRTLWGGWGPGGRSFPNVWRVLTHGRRVRLGSRQACYKRRGRPPLRYIGFWLTRHVLKVYPGYTAWVVVKVPVNGKFSPGELTCRDPKLFATSAILGGAEAHLHIAPLKLLGEVRERLA